jgi:hypothetical protein
LEKRTAKILIISTFPIVEQQGKNSGTIPFLLFHAKYLKASTRLIGNGINSSTIGLNISKHIFHRVTPGTDGK